MERTFCESTFAHKSRLESQMKVHTREKPFVCGQCNRRFASKTYLNEHTRRVHRGLPIERNKSYKCSLCQYATDSKSHLEAHLLVHTGERSFPCQNQDCEYAAKSSGALRQHNLNKHNSERKFSCQVPNCSYETNTRRDMIRHSAKHSDCKPFVCDFEGCSYRTKTKRQLKSHQLAHAEKSVECNFSGCQFFCKTKRLLRKHILNRHTQRIFECDIEGCLFTAPSGYELDAHKKNMHSDKTHKCPYCNFRAVHKSALTPHIERHTNSQRIPCPRKGCTFQASHRNYLSRHMRCHKENLGCPLEGCNYAGGSRSAWKRHMQLHDPTGRPFHCPLCPKHFSRNDVLSVHLKSHTKEKPVKCTACYFSAASKQAIKLHVRSIHPTLLSKLDEGFICNHCCVNFDSAVALAMHTIQLKTALVVLTRLQMKFKA